MLHVNDVYIIFVHTSLYVMVLQVGKICVLDLHCGQRLFYSDGATILLQINLHALHMISKLINVAVGASDMGIDDIEAYKCSGWGVGHGN